MLAAQRALRMPYVRIVNYHDVPRRLADAFAEQVAFFAEHFQPIGYRELGEFLAGRFRPERPGLIITFDDGLKSHAEIAAPVLETHGFQGWFAVPAEFPDLRVEDDHAFRRERHVDFDTGDFGEGPLLAWDDVRRLQERHVVSCHSFSHRRLSADMTDAECAREVHEAKARLEAQLDHPIRSFVWGGRRGVVLQREGRARHRRCRLRVLADDELRPWPTPTRIRCSSTEPTSKPSTRWSS